jgi:signal transduction histidine kinase
MHSELRSQFNADFTPEKYATLLRCVNETEKWPADFRVSETPIFLTSEFSDEAQRAAKEIVDLTRTADFARHAQSAIPQGLEVPNESPHPEFLIVDLGICAEGDRFVPRLIELQAFPSLFGFQFLLLGCMRKAYPAIPRDWTSSFGGIKDETYLDILRRTIVADADPENVILLEIEPEKQKTRVDFAATESLLGVRLRPCHKLMGVLYIGLSNTRPFSSGEIRRIETLADRLTVHLDNAKLHADLQDKVDALTLERGLRERFMSVLVHDLRGPLTVAKMGSAMLVNQPKMLNERPELAAKIDTNIDRVERMIRDLLDTSRIRANERLPLHLAQVDLTALAREVIQDLSPINYARFILKLEEGVRGIWDAEELRRALWNLAVNAVKYGAPDKPITITVKRSGSEAQISVHNYGSVIAPEDQASIFDSFTRTQDAQAKGQIGWGLGLTLVRGSSKAHGGKVTVKSNAALGTTFTIHLPLDARPYQAGFKPAA